jgi:hypothetical protein
MRFIWYRNHPRCYLRLSKNLTPFHSTWHPNRSLCHSFISHHARTLSEPTFTSLLPPLPRLLRKALQQPPLHQSWQNLTQHSRPIPFIVPSTPSSHTSIDDNEPGRTFLVNPPLLQRSSYEHTQQTGCVVPSLLRPVLLPFRSIPDFGPTRSEDAGGKGGLESAQVVGMPRLPNLSPDVEDEGYTRVHTTEEDPRGTVEGN